MWARFELLVWADENLQMIKNFYRWIAPLAVVAVMATVVSACPTCKDGLGEHDPHYQSLAAGFNYSILFMLSMPYVILGSFGCLAYTSIKRAKAQRDKSQA
jgi:predicted small secreted protein